MIGKDFIFIETPKCATTSFREWAFEKNLANRKLNNFLRRHIRGEAYRNIVTESSHPFKNWLAFVRNPYSRLVSQYEYLKKIGINPSEDVKNDNHTKFGKRVVDDYPTFETFVQAIRKDYQVNLHLKETTQYSFLHINCNSVLSSTEKVIPNLVKVESLHLEFELLCRKRSWDYSPLPHHNMSTKISWQDYYSRDMRNLVYNYYRKDFDIGGYLQ
jgi:hypothetical protein